MRSRPLSSHRFVPHYRWLAMLACCTALLLGQFSHATAQTAVPQTSTTQTAAPQTTTTQTTTTQAQWPVLFRQPKPKLKPTAKPTAKPKPTPGKPVKSTAQLPGAEPTLDTDTSKTKTAKPPEPPKPLFAPIRSAQEQVRGVWLTSNDTQVLHDRTKLSNAIDQMSRLNLNTVYPVIWNSGYVTYPSQVAQTMGIQPFIRQGNQGQDILAEVAAQAHRRNMLVIPWFEFGFMTPPTSELALNHPDWLTRQRNGSEISHSDAGEVAWLNPFRPEVQRFITDLVLEVLNNYNVDGIQFDDHMSLPNQFGYDDYTVALYTQETKKAPPSNPEDAAWTKWRADKITDFMVRLKQEIRQRHPRAIVSVSPNYADFAYKFHLQDWRNWLSKGIIDELVMQVYRDDLNSFTNTIARPEMVEAQAKVPAAIGILTGLRRRPISMGQIQAQVQTAQERGLGVAFFYYESLWDSGPESPRDRQAGLQYLFPQAAPRPLSN
jgi:uncharacterized lipoprotein YddW (UPF0748 family)